MCFLEHLETKAYSFWDMCRSKSVIVRTRVGLDVGHLLKSALAGGISCAFSAFLMHPVDTVKV